MCYKVHHVKYEIHDFNTKFIIFNTKFIISNTKVHQYSLILSRIVEVLLQISNASKLTRRRFRWLLAAALQAEVLTRPR